MILKPVSIGISIIAVFIILWFDSTHVLSDYDLCISQQKAVATHFSFSNIGNWTEQLVIVVLANLGVCLRLKCFGHWYDYVYLFRCLLGILTSAVVLTIEIPWDGVIHIYDEEYYYEYLYLYSTVITIFILLPSDLIFLVFSLYKKVQEFTD